MKKIILGWVLLVLIFAGCQQTTGNNGGTGGGGNTGNTEQQLKQLSGTLSEGSYEIKLGQVIENGITKRVLGYRLVHNSGEKSVLMLIKNIKPGSTTYQGILNLERSSPYQDGHFTALQLNGNSNIVTFSGAIGGRDTENGSHLYFIQGNLTGSDITTLGNQSTLLVKLAGKENFSFPVPYDFMQTIVQDF